MRLRKMGRLKSWLQRTSAPFQSQAAILLYHRVFEAETDPQRLCIHPHHFAEHLEVLRQRYTILSLKALRQELEERRWPKQAVVMTFDDGYADNLWNAKPLLERYGIPATVFVTTGYLGEEREFWWDELERLFLQPGRLPETLHLTINGRSFQWELGEAAYDPGEASRRFCTWNVLEPDDPTPRHRLYRLLHQRLRPLPHGERRKVLDELRAWAGVEPKVRLTHRPLSADEVLRLTEGGLIEVGAHSVTHPVLSAFPVAAQRTEILGSKAHLEEILGKPVTSFAYPYGSGSDYTVETVTLVREAGFKVACANFPKGVQRGTDPFQLPRFLVRDWDGEAFARRLEEWGCG